MRWRLIIDEYSPELLYVKGETNIVADALSRLDLVTSTTSPSDMHDMQYLADNFSLEDDDLPDDAYPLQYKLIASIKIYKRISLSNCTNNKMGSISNPFVEAVRNEL